MKILVVSASYKPAFTYGGPTRSISALCEALARLDVNVQVVTTTANGAEELIVEEGHLYIVEGVRVRYYRRWTGDHSHYSPKLLMAVWRECKAVDRVHIQSWWNLVSIGATMVCLLRGVKPIISPRGSLSNHTFRHKHSVMKRVFHQILGRRMLKYSEIHVTSEKEAGEVQSAVSKARIAVIPNILEFIPVSNSMQKSRDGCLRLLFIGRIDPIKNLELLFDTLGSLNGSIEFSLDIIGGGNREYVRNLQNKSSAVRNIHWLGEMDGEEKYSRIRKADVLVLLSHTENFGNVVIEALSQGTAVLVSNTVGVSKYVEKHQLGWVVQPNLDACKSSLLDINANRLVLDEISSKAIQLVTHDFGSDRLVSKFVGLYSHAI